MSRLLVHWIAGLGRAGSWLLLGLTLLCFVNVVLRSGWDLGWVAMQELVVHAHSICLLLALPWVLLVDEHVRVDIWYRVQTPGRKRLVDSIGLLLLLLPVCGLMLWASADYVWSAIQLFEGSPEAGGLPGLWLVKLVMPLSFLVLAVAGIARWLEARHSEDSVTPDSDISPTAQV